MKPVKTHIILYVDDDRDDVELLQEALNTLDGSHYLIKATDGEEGIAKLELMKQKGELPCLIVLDVNMPKMDGKKTLQLIKADAFLEKIPVVIFSTSDNYLDKLYFKDKNVEYITKPIDFLHLVKVATKLLNYCKN